MYWNIVTDDFICRQTPTEAETSFRQTTQMTGMIIVIILASAIELIFIVGLYLLIRWSMRRIFGLAKGNAIANVLSFFAGLSIMVVFSSLFLLPTSFSPKFPPVGSPPPPPASMPKTAVATVLPANVEPGGRDGVWAVILLGTSRPDNEAVCARFYRAYKLVPDPIDEFRFVLRPTYWPDVRHANDLPRVTDCGDLVANYDWIWTGAILNQLKLDGVKGPVLVAYGPTPEAPHKLVRTVLDLSSWPTSELGLAFGNWTKIITSDPVDWHGLSFIEQLRVSLRNFLISYGDSLFAAIIDPKELVGRARADVPRNDQENHSRSVQIILRD